jgi:hypothetical protein
VFAYICLYTYSSQSRGRDYVIDNQRIPSCLIVEAEPSNFHDWVNGCRA